MPERPLILFPRRDDSDRAKKGGGTPFFKKPSIVRQAQRLEPKFEQLQRAIEQKNIALQQSPTGINPECALVLDVIGSVDSFYSAVKKIDGLEWMFDISLEEIERDDDFQPLDKKGNIKDGNLSGKIYCVMTNKRAIDELISLWRQYGSNSELAFNRGFTGLRDVFRQLKDIRYWSFKDRIEETHVLEYWREGLEFDGTTEVNFEIELFYRNNSEQRAKASTVVREAIVGMNGRVISECIISEISYHCLLASLPRNQIEQLVSNYEQVALTKVDDVMFFRPVGQIVFPVIDESMEVNEESSQEKSFLREPVVAVFDGLPMQNHALLMDRLIIDDPDNWSSFYMVKDRVHGTAMSSLVIYSDLNKNKTALDSKVYVRPIFKPVQNFHGTSFEVVPNDIILVDLIHIAVKRLFEGNQNSQPAAPTVRIINLSMGDPSRQFISIMSPLARVLDWLSYKYKVLFVISAGNHNVDGIDVGIKFSEFKELPMNAREKAIIKVIEQNSRNMRLLSPSESINSLTVGALFSDCVKAEENDRFILPYENGLPSPISAVGLGNNRAIKPDIFFDGGRKYLRDSLTSTKMNWVGSGAPASRAPGCCVAVPGADGGSHQAYTFGTSDAAAQISHEGAICNSVLEDIFSSQTGHGVPKEYAAILIKAMLVHGASWGDGALTIASALDLSGKDANRVFRWLGNGIPNISKVLECARNRATLIGYGALEKEKAHVYHLPLPFDFSSRRFFRKLTVTLSYFTPIESTKQRYRSSQMWFSIENNTLAPSRVNTDDKAVMRGTIQHEVFYGEKAIFWDTDDSIKIKVNCKEDAGKFSNPIDYGLLVTFEVAEGIDTDIYTGIVTKIHELVPVVTRNL